MKRKFIILVYFFMTYFGFMRYFYWINRNRKITLTYHNVIPDHLFDGTPNLGVSHCESTFNKQLNFIRRFLKADQYLITFDDGYLNQYKIAAEILNKLKLKGTFFISFQNILEKVPLLIDRILLWVSYVPCGTYKIFNVNTIVDDGCRYQVASMFYQHLLDNINDWDIIIDQLNACYAFDRLPVHPELMKLRFGSCSIDDLRILIDQGHTLGAHSWDHRPLGTLSETKQREDFLRCATLARQYCNSTLYSYPYGGLAEVSPLTAQLCAEYGFSSAYLNMDQSPSWPGIDYHYLLPRMSLPNEKNSYILHAKLSGFESFFKKRLSTRIMHVKRTLSKMVNTLVPQKIKSS